MMPSGVVTPVTTLPVFSARLTSLATLRLRRRGGAAFAIASASDGRSSANGSGGQARRKPAHAKSSRSKSLKLSSALFIDSTLTHSTRTHSASPARPLPAARAAMARIAADRAERAPADDATPAACRMQSTVNAAAGTTHVTQNTSFVGPCVAAKSKAKSRLKISNLQDLICRCAAGEGERAVKLAESQGRFRLNVREGSRGAHRQAHGSALQTQG
jgi:hypothetical protein